MALFEEAKACIGALFYFIAKKYMNPQNQLFNLERNEVDQ